MNRIDPMPDPILRTARPADAARCFEIERAAYEGSEAAPLERIATRIAEYPEGFLVLETGGRVAGFINSGCAHEVNMADDAFKALVGHDPDAPNVVILSVAVDPAQQGRGLARVLMEAFVRRMAGRGKKRIHLICKDHHLPLYEKLGYRHVGPSASAHGGFRWHDMVMDL